MDPTSFAELNLSAKVLAAIEAAGYATPTPIQAQAIPVAMTGRDVLGIAQTGTGKTASFVLPMIARLESGRARARMPRSLILAPTRELAAQVAQSFEKYGINHKLDVALLIGGVSMDDQVRKLDRGVDVLIATPGRLLDHFQRGRVMLIGVEILVIDEADRMLDMGFIPDIEKICKLLPPRRQTLFFSATMPPEITRLVSQFLKDPVRIEVAKPATTANTITQRFRYCASTEDWEKREVLRELLRMPDVRNAIIFCNRKRDVAILLKSLQKHGFNAGALHGDMDQSSRTATLDAFRDGRIQLLAASDVAARGLDIPDVSHVFNYDIPWQPDDYVHRIGRTGRAGKQGYAASIVTPDDFKSLSAIAKLIGEETKWVGEAPDEAAIADGMSRRGRGRRGAAPKGRGREASGPPRRRTEAPRRPSDEQRAPRQEGEEQRAPRRASETPRRERGQREGAEMRERPERGAAPAAERSSPEAAQPARKAERERAPDRSREQPRERSRPQPEREEARGQPRQQGGGRDERRDRPPQQQQPRRRNDEGGSQRRGGGGNEQSPVGMGEHVPAFLRRPVRAVERS